jgi:hypothetical protein
MTLRGAVAQLAALGRLPDDGDAQVPRLEAVELALKLRAPPLSEEEAMALMWVLPAGEGSCFGLAWSVLHLIESAPGRPYRDAYLHETNHWVKLLLERAS